jgi:hypothetical protein
MVMGLLVVDMVGRQDDQWVGGGGGNGPRLHISYSSKLCSLDPGLSLVVLC